MSKHRHSPAPWKLRSGTGPDSAAFEDAAGHGVAIVRLLKEPEECGDGDRRLIEAAPELLAALERLTLKFMETPGSDLLYTEHIVDLIARVVTDPYESLRCLRCDALLVPGPERCTDGLRHISREAPAEVRYVKESVHE